MESYILVSGEKSYVTLCSKACKKNSCKCFDKYQALRKSNMSCWQNSFIRQRFGLLPITSYLSDCRIFALHLDENNYVQCYESAPGTLVMHIHKKMWSPDFDLFITELSCYRKGGLYRQLCYKL